ncbi:MAG: hypothetical protein ACR2FH_07630 [Caulobacteraceae bacterium]
MSGPVPTLDAQFRPLALVLTPAMDGYRLAFVGGTVFEVIASFATLEAARAALHAAKAFEVRP